MTSFQPMQSQKQRQPIIHNEQMNNTMATLTTNNNTSTMESPLKCLHNEWSHLWHLVKHLNNIAHAWNSGHQVGGTI